jgi:hypothetical protein
MIWIPNTGINPEDHLWEDVLELEVDPAHGEDGAVNQTGIPRQACQYRFHIVPAVKRDGQWRKGIIFASFYENFFQYGPESASESRLWEDIPFVQV